MSLPIRRTGNIFEDMEKMMGDFWSMPVKMPESRMPLINIEDKGDKLTITAELPGIEKEDLNLEVEEDLVTISGKRGKIDEEKKKNFYRCERAYSEFYRTITLPEKINPDKADARYEKGVLELVLPKLEIKKRKKEIKVK